MNNPTNKDRLLHALSLQIAATYHAIGGEAPSLEHYMLEEDMYDDLITAYRCVRRHIAKIEEDGKRFGACSAHRMMHGEI